jgi:hypothetical protein
MRDLTIGFDRRLSPGVGFRSAAFAGLSGTAEDFGLSAGLSFRSAPRTSAPEGAGRSSSR